MRYRIPVAAIVALALSGTLWSAQLLIFGVTAGWTDLVALVIAAGLFAREDTREEQESVPWPLTAALAICAVLVAALSVEQAIRAPDGGPDASAIWNMRARGLYGAPDNLRDVFMLPLPHTDYPLLLPGLVAHLWFLAGSRTFIAPVGVAFAFAAAGAWTLGAALGGARGRAAALLLLGTPLFMTLAWQQYADNVLAMLVLAAVVLASDGRFATAGLVAGLAAYTKNEGLLELGALLLATLAFTGWRAAGRLLVGSLAPLVLIVWFKLRWAPGNDLVEQTRLHDLLLRPWSRFGTVLAGFLRQLVDFPTWGCALGVVAFSWIVRRRRSLPALFVAIMLPVFFAVFLVTPQDPREHMRSALDRLIFQIFPVLLYATFTGAEVPASNDRARAGTGHQPVAA
jgi:hypothetical protein